MLGQFTDLLQVSDAIYWQLKLLRFLTYYLHSQILMNFKNNTYLLFCIIIVII